MRGRTNRVAIVLGLAVMLCATGPVLANPLPHEPGDKYLVNEVVDASVGLHFREYSLAHNGVIDYRTARQVLFSGYDEFKNIIVESKEFPLFYWFDENHDGQFEMWVDRRVEGCSCDIVRYQSVARAR